MLAYETEYKLVISHNLYISQIRNSVKYAFPLFNKSLGKKLWNLTLFLEVNLGRIGNMCMLMQNRVLQGIPMFSVFIQFLFHPSHEQTLGGLQPEIIKSQLKTKQS